MLPQKRGNSLAISMRCPIHRPAGLEFSLKSGNVEVAEHNLNFKTCAPNSFFRHQATHAAKCGSSLFLRYAQGMAHQAPDSFGAIGSIRLLFPPIIDLGNIAALHTDVDRLSIQRWTASRFFGAIY